MSISAIASQCAQLLAQAQSNRTLSPVALFGLENILVRFKIWAGNVGVFAPEKASVDYRLRQDPDIVNVHLSMLTSLKNHLERAINPPLIEEEEEEEEEGPSSALSNSGSSSSSLTLDSDAAEEDQSSEVQHDLDLTSAVRKANGVIDCLYRLTSVLRKPVSSTENSRVRGFIAKQISRGETQDFEDAEDHARCHMQARFAKAPKFLVDRLVAAVVFRKMKLLYRQRHQEKLRQGVESSFVMDHPNANLPAPTTNPLPAVTPAVTIPAPAITSNLPTKVHIPMRDRSVTYSATNASSVNKAKFATYAKSTAMSGITRSAVARRQQHDVPLPQQIFDDKLQKATCCYCMRIISKEETQEPRWTRHVLKDIDPYVCLFEDCSQGEVLFASAEEWLSHMQWLHTVLWSCQAPGHEEHIYGSETELKQHIQQDHPGSFTESQLPHLVNQGALPAADTFALLALSFNMGKAGGQSTVLCPICWDFPPRSAETGHSSTDSPPDIQDHILGHLESIALLSLPQRDHVDGAESNVQQSSENSIEAIRDLADLPPAIFDDNSQIENSQSATHSSSNDMAEPAALETDQSWDHVFRDVTQSKLPEPEQDPLLLKWHGRVSVSSVQSETGPGGPRRAAHSKTEPQLQASEGANMIPEVPAAKEESPFIAIGIDFGTTYSGVSWAHSSKPDEIYQISEWPAAFYKNRTVEQVPTQYDINTGKWGYEITPDMVPWKWFKLLLLAPEDIENEEIRDSRQIHQARQLLANTGNITATQVVGMFLRKLWDHTYEQLKSRIDIHNFPLRVAITVPAIWPSYAHQAMREAVRWAGILDPRPIGATALELVYEPEAASLSIMFQRSDTPEVQRGESFVVCDAGGGTVDVLSYTVGSEIPLVLMQCAQGQGNLAGAIRIDEAFEAHLKGKTRLKLASLTEREYNAFVTEDWELGAKVAFSNSEDIGIYILRLPLRASRVIDRWRGNGAFSITRSDMKGFFSRSLTSIRSLVHNQYREVERTTGKPPKRIFLVGGLGSSAYIHDVLNQQFEGIVVRPLYGWSAVARGAVIAVLRSQLSGPRSLTPSQQKGPASLPDVTSGRSRYEGLE